MPKQQKNKATCPPLTLDERADKAIRAMSEAALEAMKGTKQPTPKITKELRKLRCINQRTNTRTCLGLHVSKRLGSESGHRGNAWWAGSDGTVSSTNKRSQIYV